MPLTLLWLIVIGLFGLGLAGTVIPFLPGIGFVFAGTLVYGLATGWVSISPITVGIFGFVTVVAWLADYYAGALGARVGGGRLYATIGSLLGALAGAVSGGPGGLVLGALLGAFIGAMLEGGNMQKAGKVAFFSVIAVLAAGIVQFAIGWAMIVAFFLAIAL